MIWPFFSSPSLWSSSPSYGKIGNSWQSLLINGKGETMADPEGEILTLDEVAAYLKAGKRTVYRLAAEGKLPAFKLGGTWRFRRSDLDEWIAANLTNKDSGASD
jgi:excisionase family DNA binding protein